MQQQRSALLCIETARRFGCSVEVVTVGRAVAGAPVVTVRGQVVPASLSWRGDGLLIALAAGPVGVDIEPVGTAADPPWRVLAASERTALEAIADPQARHLAFLRLWTAKEAVLKALGVGLRREPATVAVTLGPDDSMAVTVDGAPLVLRDTAGGLFADGSDRFVWRAVVL